MTLLVAVEVEVALVLVADGWQLGRVKVPFAFPEPP